MVDIETTGIDPAHSHIIQIAAVRFNLETKEIDVDSMFDMSLMMMSANRFWDEGTRTWWGRQKEGLLDSILDRGQDPLFALHQFTNWVSSTPSDQPVKLFAKPISFEWPFLQSYMREYGINFPIPYWNCVDVNSYIDGKIPGNNRKKYWEGIEFDGDKHNALHDVIFQIKGLFAA